MKSRVDVVKFCVDFFKFDSYLEIGCKDNFTFDQINVTKKVGVDPFSGGTVKMYSDEFFLQNTEKFDIVFIDGDHRCRQAYRDIKNALNALNDGGIVVAHDCNPKVKEDESTDNIRCGDAWKSFVHYRQDENILSAVGDFDFGVGVIKKAKNKNPIKLDKNYHDLCWSDLVQNRENWLNLFDAEHLEAWIKEL